MRVAEVVGRTLAALGVRRAFGVVGSGNFHVTNALTDAGVAFVAARHEGGAATMADAYARVSGEVAVLSVHQGCGLTNALTGIAEAAKSRTPLLVLAGEATDPRSNFAVDQAALAAAVGAESVRVADPATAGAVTAEAYRTALHGRRTVLVNLPLDIQAATAEFVTPEPATPPPARPASDLDRLADALATAERPVFVAGRGARGARDALVELADRCGALLATSAVAKGLFRGHPFDLDICGGFASPLTAERVRGADLIVGWGCALNMWTMRHGRLIAPGATVVQVDDTAEALGRHRELTFGVHGDVGATAAAVLERVPERPGYRTCELAGRIAAENQWATVPFADTSTADRIDPRLLSRELDALLPTERVVAVDSGNFMGYPAMYLQVPDERGFCFTQAFQSIGLGLATAIGAALAQPDRVCVAALGDGGFTMAAAELETVVRLGLRMVVVIYDDAGYGAEVHHFGPEGEDLSNVTFPDVDLAAIGRGYGFRAEIVRRVADLAVVAEWVADPSAEPLLVDAKITSERGAWWLEEAFRGH